MRILITVLLALVASASRSETTAQIMSSRYLRYQLCMQRELGNDFYQRYGLDHVINRWGALRCLQLLRRVPPCQRAAS
jgi:hypothetical protein